MLSKPKVLPNQWPNKFKYQCEMLCDKEGKFIGYGDTPLSAWNDMWLQYEMWCDPELHK